MNAGAWYARSGTVLGDLWTLLHPPYTSMVLAYVTIGAAVSTHFDTTRWVGLIVAYALGLGCSAHFLDEARGHPWGTHFQTRTLLWLGAITLLPAVAIGGYFAYNVHLSFALFVVVETFFALAYNLEWFNGRFHTDAWFAFSWGALPFLASLYLQDGHLPIWSIALAAALSATAIVQISLSRWVKSYRRGPDVQSIILSEGRLDLDTPALIAQPQRALKAIVWVVDLLAVGLVLRRITA